MQAYTDEMYYINDYLKGRKPVITTDFPFYARSASQAIDRYTFNRLKDVAEIPAKRIRRKGIGEDRYLFGQLFQRSGVSTGHGQGTAQHCYEVAGRYRPVLSGGVICIPMEM